MKEEIMTKKQEVSKIICEQCGTEFTPKELMGGQYATCPSCAHANYVTPKKSSDSGKPETK